MGDTERSHMTDPAWIDKALVSARPTAIAALLRYFRDLDTAEEAFQEASLRALASWPEKGPPRDPAAWLIFVGRNAGVDGIRRRARNTALPPEDLISDREDVEEPLVESIDHADYRDDILRLLFVCCHPDLPRTQQIALALRIVSGLTVPEIARAFLVGEAAMEQRITRAKRRIGASGLPFETPTPAERAERLDAVAAMLYLLFNEGYSASGGEVHIREPLCVEAIRLGRLLYGLFPENAEIAGLTGLMLLQHSRRRARLDAEGEIVLLDEQDRALWDRAGIAEGMKLARRALDGDGAGPYAIQAAIAAVHASARHARDTDWRAIDGLYALLERIQRSPVVTLNRSVALSKLEGPQAALDMIEPLAEPLGAYFNFHGTRGAYLMQLGRDQEAREAFDRAIAIARTPAEAAHIRRHLDRLHKDAKGG
jgi:RNA polymerase sigma-70 factor (ECF subfamily)